MNIKEKRKFKVGDLIKHSKYSAINRVSKITDEGYEALNDNFISFSEEDQWEVFNHESWEPKSGDIFRKKGIDKPWYQLCNEDGEYKWSFVQIMESGIAGGSIWKSELLNEFELVERHMPFDEVLDKYITEPLKKSMKIEITPGLLERNGFVKNTHVYPYPYYEYDDKENKMYFGYAFPSGDKTKHTENWLEVDGENVVILHLPCKYKHQLNALSEMFNLKLKIE